MATVIIINDAPLRRIMANMPGIEGKIAGALAFAIEAKWKAKMGTGNPGRAYKRHVASAPGGPPAIDTGTFRNSIHTEPDGGSSYIVADGVGYGVMLEFGTRKMGARPSLQPSVDEVVRDAEQIVRGVTDGLLR